MSRNSQNSHTSKTVFMLACLAAMQAICTKRHIGLREEGVKDVSS